MPDEGASMADAPRKRRRPAARRRRTARHPRETQDKPTPEYEIKRRRKEPASVVERADAQGEDDGTDQVFRPDQRDT
jgi:hypothetical protein